MMKRKKLSRSSSSYYKRKVRVAEEEPSSTVDRISSLPDSILHHILSFLDSTIDVVRTSCILSNRWRYVWTSHPDLIFRCEWPSFTEFVKHVLSRRDHSNVRILHLTGSFVDPKLVYECISYAIHHNVQVICVQMCCGLKFPSCFFTCESLRVLKLEDYGDASMELPISLGLKSLKTIHLNAVIFSNENFNGKIFSDCPNLETLVLINCEVYLECLNISAPQLRNLEILCPDPTNPFAFEYKVVASTPKLSLFKFQGYVSLEYCSMGDLPCLDKVDIDANFSWFFQVVDLDDIKQKRALNLIKALEQLHNARSITLSLDTIEVLSIIPHLEVCESVPFPNLENLKLRARKNSTTIPLPANVMNYLLKISSCAKTIVVEVPKAEGNQVETSNSAA